MEQIVKVFEILLKEYGPQGWWPLVSLHGKGGGNPTKTGAVEGYHPGDYSFPHDERERFEICCGAILTQNTGWVSVEKALLNLKKIDALSVKGILGVDEELLRQAIKPAGYFNQKAKKLKIFAEFFGKLDGRVPSREELLDIWGVGPETADSILLYGFGVPVFVIDAYTKRIFSRLGVCKADVNYEELQEMFVETLGGFTEKNLEKFNEYHALIVEHAKRYCRTKPECEGCVLKKNCAHTL
ncbi:TPA: endonuclease III domain-containing protein [Candidatus Woesearchaeota archaeon]|nr:endonuclease III domain-containing protein [Candidatus Woesearchaeota archaeon]